MTLAEFAQLQWHFVTARQYVIRPPFPSSIIANPCFCFPYQSPDNQWHLFSHSFFGIQQYQSEEGIHWKNRSITIRHAMGPYLYSESPDYFLFYEKYEPFQSIFPFSKWWKWNSHIEMRHSRDLKKWSAPRIILKPTFDWHQSKLLGRSVSNPCLIRRGDQFILYYSASQVGLKGTGFRKPEYIGMAIAKSIDDFFAPLPETLLSPDENDPWKNRGSGSIKVTELEDGFLGLQNGIYWSQEPQQLSASLLLLQSKDGISWDYLKKSPLLQPSHSWMQSYIGAGECRLNTKDNKWYLYFSAGNKAHLGIRKERIGLIIGQ